MFGAGRRRSAETRTIPADASTNLRSRVRTLRRRCCGGALRTLSLRYRNTARLIAGCCRLWTGKLRCSSWRRQPRNTSPRSFRAGKTRFTAPRSLPSDFHASWCRRSSRAKLKHRSGRENSVAHTSSITRNNREKEWAVLVECASGQPSAPHLSVRLQDSFDWRELLARAEQQGMLGLLAEQLKNLNPPPRTEIREGVREWQRRQTVHTLSLTAEMFRLLEHFASLGI